MDIVIDQNNIDYTLEDEHTVGEVVNELRPFIESHARSISALSVDDERLSIDDPAAWKDRTLEPIREIRIETAGAFDREITDLRTVLEYFAIFRRTLTERRAQQIDEVLGELPHLQRGIGPLLDRAGSGEGALAELNRLLEEHSEDALPSGEVLSGLPAERVEALASAIDRILLVLDSRLRELTLPRQELERTAEVLRGYTESVIEVPVLLQTGKDRDAMERIAGFSHLTAKLLRLCSLVMNDRTRLAFEWNPKELEREAEGLNGALTELVEAFGAGDSVLIGDLVEYEIVPGLQELLRHLPSGNPTP